MKTFVVFVSNPQYAPAQQFINLLTTEKNYRVRGLKKPNAVAAPPTSEKVEWSSTKGTFGQEVKDIFQGCEAAFMFVMPADLPHLTQLTRTFLEVVGETGVRQLAWVAPACPKVSALGKRLAEAEALVRSSNLETLVLRHAPLFSDLLDHKKELQYRRTLSLPLGSSTLPWLAPEIIALGLYKWVLGEVNNQPPDVLTGSVYLKGDDIAKGLSQAIKQNVNTQKFAQRRFQSIDVEKSGHIDAEKLFPYLLELGYSNDKAQHILEEADKDKSGSINFQKFIHGLEEHLNKILADVPIEVKYFNVPQFTALYDLMSGGMDENTAKSRLDSPC